MKAQQIIKAIEAEEIERLQRDSKQKAIDEEEKRLKTEADKKGITVEIDRAKIATDIEKVQAAARKDIPLIRVGDTIKVGVKIQEGNKERVQPYEGIIIARHNAGLNSTITVRRIFQGVGVERVFLIHSPRIASIVIVRKGKVRRAKLYYLRDRVGKATRVKQRFDLAEKDTKKG